MPLGLATKPRTDQVTHRSGPQMVVDGARGVGSFNFGKDSIKHNRRLGYLRGCLEDYSMMLAATGSEPSD